VNEEVDSISVISLALQSFLPFCFGFCKQGHTIAEHCLTCSLRQLIPEGCKTTASRSLRNTGSLRHTGLMNTLHLHGVVPRQPLSLVPALCITTCLFSPHNPGAVIEFVTGPFRHRGKHESCNTNTSSRTNHMAIILACQCSCIQVKMNSAAAECPEVRARGFSPCDAI